MRSQSVIQYIPGDHKPLNGVRGIAILAVMIFHIYAMAPLNILTDWGRDGVDIFFVLSGFLITGLLLDTKASDAKTWSFYMRRILRIFPLYLLCVCGYLLLRGTADYSPLVLLSFTLNIQMALHGANPMVILNHLWSIAMEEQFYLCWPLIVYLIPSRALKWLMALVIILAPVLRFTSSTEDFAYFFPFCRMDSIAFGCLAMLVLRSGEARPGLTRLLLLLGLVGFVGFTVYHLSNPEADWHFYETGIHSFVSLVTACVIVLSYTPTCLNKILTNSFLGFFGKYSYGIYIIHVPVLYIIDTRFHFNLEPSFFKRVAIASTCIPVTLLLAYLSYHLFEKHFLRLKRFFPTKNSTARPVA